MDDDKDESERLDEALSLNTPLALAYYLEEELAWGFEERTKTRACRFLKDWIEGLGDRFEPTGDLRKAPEDSCRGEPVAVRPPISTGSLEGWK